MIIKNKKQKQQYFEACEISVKILRQIYDEVKVGAVPLELDKLAGELCKKYGVKPAFLDVHGKKGIYGYNTCIQINDVAVHGVPVTNYALKSGDVISVDFGIIYHGLFTDHCFSVGVGAVSSKNKKLLQAGRESVLLATKEARTGNTTGDIGHILESVARKNNFDTLKKYTGHGIGETLHDSPAIPAYGRPGEGSILRRNEVICVESQVVAGKIDVVTDPGDGWTVRTRDGKNSVMFEFMVLVDNVKPVILTPTQDWPLVK